MTTADSDYRPTFVDTYHVSDDIVNRFASTSLPETETRSNNTPTISNGEVLCAKPHRIAYEAAKLMVDGDLALLRANPDGSVTILNKPRY